MSRAYCYTHRILFEETNFVGNVYFVNYVRWQGHCRERFLVDYAPSVIEELQSGNLALVTVNCHVDYLGECFAGSTVSLMMSQADGALGGNRISLKFSYESAGQLIATGKQTVACMRRRPSDGALEAAVVPIELRDALLQFQS